MSYIEIQNVRKRFGDHEVLRDVSLSIGEHEFVSFLGSSGCGKTTLLRCIVGLETVDSGRILLDGRDITHVPPQQRGISMIFQQYCLFPTMDLYNNVSFGLRMQKLPADEIRRRVNHVLEIVNMTDHIRKYPYQMSGGEQQRAALARALIMDPKVLLLDEPFSAIDAKLRKDLQVYLKDIHRKLGMTSVFVTHDQEEAMRMSDRIHLFNNGILEQSDTPYGIYAHPKTPFVASFIGSYNLYGPEEAEKLFGVRRTAAIRPELVGITKDPAQDPNDEQVAVRGQVTNLIPQGSIVRYVVRSEAGPEIKADVIFTSDLPHELNEEVFIRMRKEDLIFYQ